MQMVTFGFYTPRWMRSDYPKLTGAGLFDAWSFDPLTWKSNYPNPAFLMMDREDAFWAAKQVAAFTDEEISRSSRPVNTAIDALRTGSRNASSSAATRSPQAWFSRVLPLDRFRIAEGRLAFDDLGAGGSPKRAHDVHWSSFDNDIAASLRSPTPTGRRCRRMPARLPCGDDRLQRRRCERLSAIGHCVSAASGAHVQCGGSGSLAMVDVVSAETMSIPAERLRLGAQRRRAAVRREPARVRWICAREPGWPIASPNRPRGAWARWPS